jgi:adenylate cyclase
MIDVILTHDGIVDKFIGDAIMAFWGAPVKHDADAYQSVLAGLGMLDALGRFNGQQVQKGRRGFRIGMGINYGLVTLGNMGSEKKMDYTVIGDMVNLASRLEGLTKIYKEQLIFSESVFRAVGEKLPCRKLGRVRVKGKSLAIDIFTARRQLTAAEEEGWGLHQLGLDLYYNKEFEKAASCFSQVKKFIPDDVVSGAFLERCRINRKLPPDPAWDGVEIISEK